MIEKVEAKRQYTYGKAEEFIDLGIYSNILILVYKHETNTQSDGIFCSDFPLAHYRSQAQSIDLHCLGKWTCIQIVHSSNL